MTIEVNNYTINIPKVCGVLVEPRQFYNIHDLIENFMKVMSSRVLYFFCGNSEFEYYKNYYCNEPFVKVKNLGVDNLNAKQHNDLWKTLEFWNNFTDYTHVLTIQTDGCLCENSEFTIEHFFKYDFVGGYTPNKWWWKETEGLHKYSDYQCFNGGFSFRNISAMKDVLNTFTPLPTEDFSQGLSFKSYGEDLYFVVGLLRLNSMRDQGFKYNVGLDEFATNFCTHTHFLRKTFCVHKYDNYVSRNLLNKFLEYCPLFLKFTALGY